MLDEYFSITINESGELERLPLLLKDYTPDINAIPTLLMNLGPLVGDISLITSLLTDNYR